MEVRDLCLHLYITDVSYIVTMNLCKVYIRYKKFLYHSVIIIQHGSCFRSYVIPRE